MPVDVTTEPHDLRLDDQLCFALYAASRAVVGRYRDGLDAIGLTYSQYLVMMVLWERGDVTMGALGRELHLDSGTLSPLLKRLESRGLVTRRRRLDDERTVEVSCTDAGRELHAPASCVQSGVQDDTGLSSDELAGLRDQLHAVTRRLHASTGASTGASSRVG